MRPSRRCIIAGSNGVAGGRQKEAGDEAERLSCLFVLGVESSEDQTGWCRRESGEAVIVRAVYADRDVVLYREGETREAGGRGGRPRHRETGRGERSEEGEARRELLGSRTDEEPG